MHESRLVTALNGGRSPNTISEGGVGEHTFKRLSHVRGDPSGQCSCVKATGLAAYRRPQTGFLFHLVADNTISLRYMPIIAIRGY